jgi:hypothetical protein
MITMENWSLVLWPFSAPEVPVMCLHGKVYGRPIFEDGDEVTTTRIKKIKVEGPDITVITRSGTEYRLGVVDPDYEAAYPDARARVVASVARYEAHELAEGGTD